MKAFKAQTRRTPIYRDSGFPFEDVESAGEAIKAEAAYPQSNTEFIYTRYGNPTVSETEQAIAKVEGSQWAMAATSGMSAIEIALSIFQEHGKTGTWLFLTELYGGTNGYIAQVLEKRRGIAVERFAPQDEKYAIEEFAALLDRVRPQLLYFEVISNPLLIVADAIGMIQAAKERGVKVIIDNTFATPILFKPLEHGADLVIHSATKYFGGHGDITAGAICGNDVDLHSEAMTYRRLIGHTMSPDDAYRLTTQIKTLELRFKQQCESALKLARVLEDHPKISSVRYPGLDIHRTYAEAVKQFEGRGFGAVVTFDMKGGREAVDAFVAAVGDRIPYVMTLGDSESIVTHVPSTFGAERFPYPGMMRLSVGFEPYEELESAMLGGLAAT
jgi:cystathionine beta-lyase/cystathionine gamma-synthase